MSVHIDNLQKIKSWFVIHQEFELAMDVKNAIDHFKKLEVERPSMRNILKKHGLSMATTQDAKNEDALTTIKDESPDHDHPKTVQ